jgi:hypothetical protein
MKDVRRNLTMLTALTVATIMAACGGGSTTPGPSGPGGGSGSPTPTPVPGINDAMNVATGGVYPSYSYSTADNASVVFSCGCSGQAGTSTASGSGVVTLAADSSATPSAPSPTYTIVPSRNYIIVATTNSGAEAWDIQFAGRKPSHNLSLNGNFTSDVYTAAVALYVYGQSSIGSTAFDNWNFNTLKTWYGTLQNSPNTAEKSLLNDIASQSAASTTLYPESPGWDLGHATNSTIRSDIAAVKASIDSTKPTPCPSSGCTQTPTP